MKKPTLIDSDFNPDDHTSTVTIGTDIGQFTASVMTLPADYPFESRYFGCQLAEMKATRKWALAHYHQIRQRMKGLKDFWNAMAGTREFNPYAYYVKVLKKQYDRLEEEATFWSQKADSIERAYRTCIVTQDGLNHRKGVFYD